MRPPVTSFVARCMLALMFAMLAGGAYATTATAPVDYPSTRVALQLYCSTGTLLQGDVGLMIGLVLVFVGLWSMIGGAKLMTALPFIIMGALVTALPSLVEASLTGLQNLLVAAKISTASTGSTSTGSTGTAGYSPPTCPAATDTSTGATSPNAAGIQAANTDPQTGQYYPSHGAPTVTTTQSNAASDNHTSDF